MALCRSGDEVVIPSPYWLSYPEMVRVAGGTPVFVPCRQEDGFCMSPEQFAGAITDRTRAVVINSPSNPIGNAYDAEALRALAEIAVEKGITIVSDEIYEKIVYDGFQHTSVGSLSPEIFAQTVTANGFSKTYSMTGWRLGYFAGPVPVVKAAIALQSHSTSGANTFAQYGALEALRGPQACVGEMAQAFAERRELLYARLTGIQGVTCVKPQGAFYMFPNVSAFGLDSVTFAERLLEEHGVAMVPGAPFGADGHVRLSYACSLETIEKGMDGMERFMASL
jgi:aspartate aminotransferase